MSVRIEVTSLPQKLCELERLCDVARQQGFPDDAYVSIDGNRISVRTDEESVEVPIRLAPGGAS